MFALNVTAFSADGACNDTKSVVTNVTAATRPSVSVTGPSGNASVCLGVTDSQALDFIVGSTNSANITSVVAPLGAADCVVTPDAARE
jgi:hypothetical protein